MTPTRALALAALLAGCGAPPSEDVRSATGPCAGYTGGSLAEVTFSHGGFVRRATVDLPAGYDASEPVGVVLNFHGSLGTAAEHAEYSGMVAAAIARGLVAVHPDGVDAVWNAGHCCRQQFGPTDVPDVDYVRQLLDQLENRLCIDRGRVFATGYSNGGMMAYRLACELSDRVAAVASVAGPDGTVSCAPSQPVSVVHFHGTDDGSAATYDDGMFPGAVTSASGWASRLACDTGPTEVMRVGDVHCQSWSGCHGGTEVRLCTVEGGGHTWPGAPYVQERGPVTNDIDATEEMLDFFEANRRRL